MSAQPLPYRRQVTRLTDWLLNPTQAAMRRIALAGVIASAIIIPSGAGVRLSESGLGCSDWPKCTAASLLAAHASGGTLVHRWIEFGNRLVTALIFVVAIAVLVAAWRFRSPEAAGRRRDLVWLAAAQPAGILAQAVIGGIVVLTKLAPFWVSLHYLATLPVLAAAVTLHVRCAEGTEPPRYLVPPLTRLVARALVTVTAAMLVAGTLVTGTGPLAGAPSVPRYHFLSLAAVTQLHADIGWVLGTLALMTVLVLHLTQAPVAAIRLGWISCGLIGLQGVIGYVQYFTGLPAGLVWVHVANTAIIWIAVLRLGFALRDRLPIGLTEDLRAEGVRA